MAPPKPAAIAVRRAAAERVIAFLDADAKIDELPVALSEIKGLFSRVARQDQWDWFTTSRMLGYPSAHVAGLITRSIGNVRRALLSDAPDATREEWLLLRRLPCRPCLRILLDRARIADEDGAGWIYLLSTREMPDLLKIGMTTRSVEQRLREINSATGLAFPFGVRRCWRVRDPAHAERLIHLTLDALRVRNDREFFRANFHEAARSINETLSTGALELRTLDNLVVVPVTREDAPEPRLLDPSA